MPVTHHDLEEILDRIGELYEDLLMHQFNPACILIPRTTDPNDEEAVCNVQFIDAGEHWNIQVNCIDEDFTNDEIYGFLIRAEESMKQTLQGYKKPVTIH